MPVTEITAKYKGLLKKSILQRTYNCPFTNRHTAKLHPKYLSLYPKIIVVLTPHQENISLQQSTLKKTATVQNSDMWSPVPYKHMDTSLTGFLHLRFRYHGAVNKLKSE